jgi:hypothetical protein
MPLRKKRLRNQAEPFYLGTPAWRYKSSTGPTAEAIPPSTRFAGLPAPNEAEAHLAQDRLTFERESFGRESYFCESYKRFFDYAMPKFLQIADAINAGSPVKTQPFL